MCSICKIRWNSGAFLPLRCLVDLWRFQSHVLPTGTNAPIHHFLKYLPQTSDLISWYSCRRWSTFFLWLKGCWTVRSGHFRSRFLWDSLDFWRWLFTGRHGQVPSGGRKRREMVGIVDLGIGKARWVVWFMFLWTFVMSDRLIYFHHSEYLLDSVLSFTSEMTCRTGSTGWIGEYRYTYLLCTPGKLNGRCWPYNNQFSDHKLTYSSFSLSGLVDWYWRPVWKGAIS